MIAIVAALTNCAEVQAKEEEEGRRKQRFLALEKNLHCLI